ncbi:hypothetical protein [Enterococcus alishanensis]
MFLAKFTGKNESKSNALTIGKSRNSKIEVAVKECQEETSKNVTEEDIKNYFERKYQKCNTTSSK